MVLQAHLLQVREALRGTLIQLLNPLLLPVIPLRLGRANIVSFDEFELML